MWLALLCWVYLSIPVSLTENVTCGGNLTAPTGTLITPGFPKPFPVPLKCKWLIAAQNPTNDVSIVVYLTQLYSSSGLKFTEYRIYNDDVIGGSNLVHEVTEGNVATVKWLQVRSHYLVVEFEMNRLEGNHIRALDNLLDVYGFNITYEISTEEFPVKQYQCNILECRFLGHCYASKDFSEYKCSCFDGFSGSDCGQGPLCKDPAKNGCENGAACSHMGAAAVTCKCSPGYSGDKCDIPDSVENRCGGSSGDPAECLKQCPFDGRPENVCECRNGFTVKPDRVRFEATVRLNNVTALKDRRILELEGLLEKQMKKLLKNTVMEELRILNISTEAELTFHFFGDKKDGNRVAEAVTKMTRGRLGNLSLVPNNMSYNQKPALLLQSVTSNHNDKPILEGGQFILSCMAQGSRYMSFRWYKDKVFVNVTIATRNMWVNLMVYEEDKYAGLLTINNASRLDEGRYTCQVEDWGMQQCKSVYVGVLSAPEVKVEPLSATIQKGSSINIKCLSPNNDHRHGKLGYSWTKNNALFSLNSSAELWEDLSPDGSILKIHNAQKSAKYTCHVTNKVPRSESVSIAVVEGTRVSLCPREHHLQITWDATMPGNEAVMECPKGFVGHARRLCEQQDFNTPEWALPDYSSCVSNIFVEIITSFRRLTSGYNITTVPVILELCLEHLKKRNSMFPGEGEHILGLIQETASYLNSSARDDLLRSSGVVFEIVNEILRYEHSVLRQQRVIQIQMILRMQALLWSSLLKPSYKPLFLRLSQLQLRVFVIDKSPFNNQLAPANREYWFGDSIEFQIDSILEFLEYVNNTKITMAILTYRNLSKFLPKIYYTSKKDGSELEYKLISRLTTVELGRRGHAVFTSVSPGFLVNITFAHSNANKTGWMVSCGSADIASSNPNWVLDACVAKIINESFTRCSCLRPGTYAVLITKRILYNNSSSSNGIPVVILTGCCCCLLQTSVTLFVLVPYWLHRRTCLVFLKLQCCVATSAGIIIIIYAVRRSVPHEAFPYTTTLLVTFFLIGMSSHLSMVLIVYTELVAVPTIPHLQQSVVGVISGVPVLAALCGPLIHSATGREPESWWLENGTLMFNIFIATASVMIGLFIFLYANVMKKLKLLTRKHGESNKSITKRIGLLQRAAIIFTLTVSLEVGSLCYTNIKADWCQYLLGCSSAFLGLAILLFYVIKSETTLRYRNITKFKKNFHDDFFVSESVNNPLNFFTKQDGETESEGAPPRSDLSRVPPSSLDNSEELLLNESRSSKLHHCSSEGAPSTIETYLGGSSEGTIENCKAVGDGENEADVDLENYPQSPRKYANPPSGIASEEVPMFCEYVEADNTIPLNSATPDQWRYMRKFYQNADKILTVVRPEQGRCYLRDTTPINLPPGEFIKTRVCVELGVDPGISGDCLTTEANISVEAPSIVLCSVDVEPCVLGNRELNSVSITDSRVVCNGNNLAVCVDTAQSLNEFNPNTLDRSNGIQNLDIIKGIDQISIDQTQHKETEKVMPVITITEDDENMLDKISHDLDYLLNRKCAVGNQHPHSQKSLRRSPKPTTRLIGQIKEEDEEPDEHVSISDTPDTARTAC